MTWDDLESFAFGQIRLKPDEFYDLTPREWSNLVHGFNELENRKEQSEWERIRWQTTILLNPHTKKRIKSKDLIIFPWETEAKERKVWTKGEVLDAINQRIERAKIKNGKSIES